MAFNLSTIASRLGLTDIGVAKAGCLDDEIIHINDWLKNGLGGEMGFLARTPHRRCDPREVMPACRSVIVCTMRYADMPARPSSAHGSAEYLRHEDYHKVMGERLEAVAMEIRREFPDAECKCYCDTGPVLEKAWGQRAGLGFIGKNTLLIHPQHGSQMAVGAILCSVERERLPPNPTPWGEGIFPKTISNLEERGRSSCGHCTACIDACPEGALVAPYRLDARKCASYKFFIAKKEGGCDTCQQVCPFNQ